jgi:hypothetical protein
MPSQGDIPFLEIGGCCAVGLFMEVILSHMRYIATQLKKEFVLLLFRILLLMFVIVVNGLMHLLPFSIFISLFIPFF